MAACGAPAAVLTPTPAAVLFQAQGFVGNLAPSLLPLSLLSSMWPLMLCLCQAYAMLVLGKTPPCSPRPFFWAQSLLLSAF